MKPFSCSLRLVTHLFASFLALSTFSIGANEIATKQSSTDASDNFYEWANEDWLSETTIPEDKPRVDNFTQMQDDVYAQLKLLMIDLESRASLTDEQKKLVILYKSYMDMDKRNQIGMKPIADELAAINTLKTHKDVALHFAEIQSLGIESPLIIVSETDFKDSAKKIAYAVQAGLGIERDYYLGNDQRSQNQIELYREFITNLFNLAEVPDSESSALEVIQLEKKLAEIQWSNVQNRDLQKLYNPLTASRFNDLTQLIYGKEMLSALGVPNTGSEISIMQPSYVNEFNLMFQTVNVDSWKLYLKARLLVHYSTLLSEEFKQASVLYKKKLGIYSEEPPMWRQSLDYISSTAGQLLGRAYVEQYFDDADKETTIQLVMNIRDSYKEAIAGADWLTISTKSKALDKLERMKFQIGYPDKWIDFTSLQITSGDIIGNDQRVARHAHERNMMKIGQLVDPSDWDHSPHEINAYYDPTKNTFVLLAGILHTPFFNAKASQAENYGGIGFIIGHEIGHGFDDQGSQFDAAGNMQNWWAEKDRASYNKIKQSLIVQANNYEILPDTFLNGDLEIGEIMGDLSGAQVALIAYRKALEKDGKTAEGVSDKPFFIQLARTWRSKWREEFLRTVLQSNPHPPSEFRANGIVKQFDSFYEEFDIKIGDPMYISPEQRVTMW